LALVVVNLVLSALLIFTCMPAISKTSNLVDKICEIVDLDVKGSSDENTTVDITKLEEVAVTFNGETTASLNLKTGDDGKPHVIVVGVSIILDTSHADYSAKHATINSAMSMIDSAIIDVITQYTMDQANNNKEEIRKEILGRLQELFDSKFIYDISFTSFITQ
ncbi:MAG: flagellar basal body-associated FliL family protein, partial [Lachnospiraceae bacterium]